MKQFDNFKAFVWQCHTTQSKMMLHRGRTGHAKCRKISVDLSDLKAAFWAEAVNTANYVQIRSPTSNLGEKTAYEPWFKRPPDVSYLQRFGNHLCHEVGEIWSLDIKRVSPLYIRQNQKHTVWLLRAHT